MSTIQRQIKSAQFNIKELQRELLAAQECLKKLVELEKHLQEHRLEYMKISVDIPKLL